VRRICAAAAVACVAALAAIGCGSGGGPSDEEKIKTALTTYYQAFASGDQPTACDQLAKETVEALEKQAKGKICPRVLDAALQRPGYASVAQRLTRATITKVTIAGDKATVSLEVPGLPARAKRVPVLLKKEGDGWKITNAPR
jgi:putative lumazine-binding protein